MEITNEQYGMFVYNMLNPLAEARCKRYRLLTHAVMGLISEFQEFKQAMSLAEFDTDVDNMTPEDRQLIRDAELEAADIHFFATLFKTEMANLFKEADDGLAKNPCLSPNFWNSYRKWLYQGNDRAMKCWHAHILQILKECDEFYQRLYPCESKEFIHERLSKVSINKLTKRYGGERFDARIEANR